MRRRRFEPQHPGSQLQAEFLDDYELTAEAFASAIRVPHERVLRVLAGSEAVDADMALRLARLLGGSAEVWLSWQRGYDLWHAHERIGAELETITPLDPDTRLSVREEEPLEPELVEELRRRMADVRDPRRWLVVSNILGGEVPLHEESICRMFYDVESGCYCTDLRGATPFKSQKVAQAVAAALGERKVVLEVTKQDLDGPQRDDAVDRELRDRFFRFNGQGMSEWDVTAYLRDKADMAAYLEAAADDGNRELITVAVDDVMKAMTAQTQVEYLKARGVLGNSSAFEAALEKVGDVPPDEGDEM